MKKPFILFVLFIFMVSICTNSQSLDEDFRIHSALKLAEVWLDAEIAYKDIPGLSAGIVDDQKLLWSKGFGYADITKKTQAAPDTIYSICSISKLFTSIAVIQLRDQGKLDLDKPIKTYLPWFNIVDKYPDAPPITLRGILTHSSGLPREADYPYWTGPDFPFPTREEIIKKLSDQEELYPAQTYFQYSNLGMALAGEVIAAVSKKPYAAYITENVIAPLGLTHTTPEIPRDQIGNKLATGYSVRLREGGREKIPFYLVNGIAPAAGFASTVEDLARFASWQFRLLEQGGQEIISANSLREMHRVQWMDPDWQTSWGFGFSVSRQNNKNFVGHGGNCPGYRTQIHICPQDKIATIAMTNAHDANPSVYTQYLYEIIEPALSQAKKNPYYGKDPDSNLEKFIGRYVRSVGRESFVLMWWESDLAIISLPNDNPIRSLTKLKYMGGNSFQRIREEGNLGEIIIFEPNSDGKIIRMIWNSQISERID
jgi:CubicO group peptidase (beta-lactamase class C family)